MFYFLSHLKETFFPFNVFQYITFRAAYATVTALLISFILGPPLIRKLRRIKAGQPILEDLPKEHQSKAGTPTMGGILILASLIGSTLLWARLDNPLIYVVLFASLWFGALGFWDDYVKVTKKRSLGLKGWHKIILQSMGALAIAFYIYAYMPVLTNGIVTSNTALMFPFLKNFRPDLGIFFIPFAMLVIIGCSNAVNLTDGLDGLAITCTIFVASTYAILSYLTSHAKASEYLDIVHITQSGELTVFCTALVGAGLGFLWYNCHPAQIIMGDTGSLALGAVLGTIAVLIKEEILLVLVGGIFVIEAMSVILQVWSFKTRGKRIFRMAPLHHHFEKIGWPETKVVIRFWIIAAMLALVALTTLKLR